MVGVFTPEITYGPWAVGMMADGGSNYRTIQPSSGVPDPLASIPAFANLAFALQAQDIPVQTDNTALTSWTDVIGGLVFTQVTGARQPKYRDAASGVGEGGQPTVEFTGNQSLTFPKTGAGAALTAIINSLNYTAIAVIHGATTQANASPFATHTSASGLYMTATSSTSVGQLGGFFQGENDFDPGGFCTFGITGRPSDGSFEAMRGYVNGGCVSQSATVPPASSGTDFTVGQAGGLTNNGLRGFINAIYIWDRRLTPTEMAQVDDWCREAAQWNQTNPRVPGVDILAFDGDSLTAGVSASNCRFSYPYITRADKGLLSGQWSNFAVGGRSWTGMLTYQPDLDDYVAYLLGRGCTVRLAVWEWYNTRLTSPTSTVIGYAQTYLTQAYASGIASITFGTTTDYNGTPTLGKTTWTGWWDTPANRTGYMDAYVAIHLDTNIGIDGAAVAGSGVYFAGDLIHLRGVSGFPGTPSGYPVLASLFSAAIP